METQILPSFSTDNQFPNSFIKIICPQRHGVENDHLVHVSTQLPYSLTVAAISFVMFIIAGYVQNWIICLAIGVVLTFAVAFALKVVIKDKKA